jgi:hypothetical protein
VDFPGLGQGNPEEELRKLLAVSGAALVVDLVYGGILFAILIYYLIVMSRALAKVSPENRDMEPGMAYLGLIPCFQLVWLFFIVARVTSSLEKEFAARGLSTETKYGKTVGLVGCILLCFTCSPAWIICGLLHARRVKACLRQLEAAPPMAGAAQDDGYSDEF